MCGIIGAIGIKDEEFIKSAVKTTSHRGPDYEASFFSFPVSLGHNRLSIQDLTENGNQPMFSEDQRYIIIFNGEIYNHQDIREKLKNKYNFKSTSDTETLLYGYIEYGKNVLNMLNGIFAFSIYDTVSGVLIIARDPFGVKPLYYYHHNNILLFGSEIKSFLHYSDFDQSLNYNALTSYIQLLWSPGELTPFARVKKLNPGCFIEVNVKETLNINPERYYEIPFTGNYLQLSEKELTDKLEAHLLNALQRQLLSDVPIGFFLSGGLDSSCLVALTRKLFPEKKIQCFTIANEDMDKAEGFSDDLFYAKKVADHLKIDLEIVKAKVDIVNDFDKMIWHLDEPQADPAPLHVLNICKRAKEMGYKVLIGGTAGDDVFSGYRRHQALALEKYLKFIPKPVRKTIKGLGNFLDSRNPQIRKFKKLTMSLGKDKTSRLKAYYSWLEPEKTQELFSPTIKSQIKLFDPSSYFDNLLDNIPNEKSDLNKMLYWEMRTFLVDHNLNYTDKMSMATGVEVRVPFLDKELVEFSTMIPPHLKMKGTTTKYLLKKVMERYLPLEIIYRSKTGFGAPVRNWITNELEWKIKRDLDPELINKGKIFNAKTIWKLIEDNKAGKVDASYSIWALLAIQSWINQFANTNTSKTKLEDIQKSN